MHFAESPEPASPPASVNGSTAPPSGSAILDHAATPAPAQPSVAAFIAVLKKPLPGPLISSAPRPRPTKGCDHGSVPRRSDRLAVKSAYCDPVPEKQARRVLLGCWNNQHVASYRNTPDATVATRFHATFLEPLSSTKRAAMRELFPRPGPRRSRAASTAL